MSMSMKVLPGVAPFLGLQRQSRGGGGEKSSQDRYCLVPGLTG